MKVRLVSVLAIILMFGADAPKEPAVPELNRKVLEFCQANRGKKVGDGECATLAIRALRAAKARPMQTTRDGEYVWGKLVRTVTAGTNLTGEVLPGDILQFRNATFMRVVKMPGGGRGTIESGYPHHTAVVAAVKNDGAVLEVLHQNVADQDKKDEDRRTVQRGTVSFADLQKGGGVKIYRPVPRE